MINTLSVSAYRFGEQVSLKVIAEIALLARHIWSIVKNSFQTLAYFFSSNKSKQFWTNERRIQISNQTLQAIENGGYQASRNTFVLLQSGEALSQKSQLIAPSPINFTPHSYPTQFRVASKDCLELAREYVSSGLKTAVVVFASPIEPGGGFTDGTNGQEEHICYRTEMAGFFQNQLHRFINGNSFYQSPDWCDPTSPIHRGIRQNIFHPGGLIHIPDVLVFRESQAKGFGFLNHPFKVGMLVSPAPVNPNLITLDNGKICYASDEADNKVRITLQTQLEATHKMHYEAIILGAFGCGAFQNPPDAIARLYKEIIERDYPNTFKHIAFAILDDPNRGKHNPKGNLLPFQETFSYPASACNLAFPVATDVPVFI